MIVKINGTEKEFSQDTSLESVITSFAKNPDHVIAEVNGEIIKKPAWTQTSVKDGDVVELVSFVGGG